MISNFTLMEQIYNVLTIFLGVELFHFILRVTGYLWYGSRVGDGCHDFIDELHGDVTHNSGSLVLLMGEGLRGFALFSNYECLLDTGGHTQVSKCSPSDVRCCVMMWNHCNHLSKYWFDFNTWVWLKH